MIDSRLTKTRRNRKVVITKEARTVNMRFDSDGETRKMIERLAKIRQVRRRKC